MAAQHGNANAIRHGLLSANGAPFPGVRKVANALRRTIEQAVLARHGEIDLLQAAWISSAVRWECHGLLCQRWLRIEHQKLSAADRLSYSREVARASSERDKCLERLKVGKPDLKDWWQDFYRQPLTSPTPAANGTEQPQGNP